MKSLLMGISVLTPVYLYANLSKITLTYDSTIVITLISLLCASLTIALAYDSVKVAR